MALCDVWKLFRKSKKNAEKIINRQITQQ